MSKYTSIAEIEAEDKRLVILRLLEAQPRYSSNTAVITKAMAAIGHNQTREKTEQLCKWLGARELLILEYLDIEVVRVSLTTKGTEVATGIRFIQGVSRPSPGK